MRLVCHLRTIRGNRTMKDICRDAAVLGLHISEGVLSPIERGLALPTDRQIGPLEKAYGQPLDTWYEPRVLLVLQADEAAA